MFAGADGHGVGSIVDGCTLEEQMGKGWLSGPACRLCNLSCELDICIPTIMGQILK